MLPDVIHGLCGVKMNPPVGVRGRIITMGGSESTVSKVRIHRTVENRSFVVLYADPLKHLV